MKVIYKDDKMTFRTFLDSDQYEIVNNEIILPKNYYSMEYIQKIFPGLKWSSFQEYPNTSMKKNYIFNKNQNSNLDFFLDNL